MRTSSSFWLTGSRFAGWLSPLVFLSYGVVTYHGVSMLSDNVALFLFFSGFLVAYRFQKSPAILLAVPLITHGFYYKQQFMPARSPCFVPADREALCARRAIRGFDGRLGLGMFALFQWVIFRRQEFWRPFLVLQSTLFSWHQWEIGFVVFLLMFAAPVLLAFELHASTRTESCFATWYARSPRSGDDREGERVVLVSAMD